MAKTNRWRIILWGGAACLLLLPLIAMQFSDDVQWTKSDFAVAGTMLAAACGAGELMARMSDNILYRLGGAVAIAAAVLLVWVNGAVGFLGDEGNPANLMFCAVLLVAVLGATLSGFRARGMALAMFAAAAVQVLIGAGALAFNLGSPGNAGLREAVMGTGVFAALWLLSGGLFRKAARG